MLRLIGVVLLSLFSTISCGSEFTNPPIIITMLDGELCWSDPVLREDGGQLFPFEISSYNVGHGMIGLITEAEVTNVGYVNCYTIENLGVGTHQFAIQTVDSDGLPGNWSNIIEVAVEGPSRPGSVANLQFDKL